MEVDWTRDGSGFHTAECAAGPGRGRRLLAEVHRGAEAEGGCCWAWQVWSPAGGPRGMHAGTADTLAAAKAAAEQALLSEVGARRAMAAL